MISNSKKFALYASYQEGINFPGYVQFALKHLAETDFKVVLLTNERILSQESYEFLADNNIELFFTQNRGFDFGMWRRYLELQSNFQKKNNSFNGNIAGSIERLLLINDSIVYYKNNFKTFILQAESSLADVISLTSNQEYAPHLQSFFLYLKPEALGVFFLHIFETPEQTEFYSATRKLEVALSEKFANANIKMESLFHTERPVFFAYKELILQNAGFIKRKLLQKRFNYKEKKHFIRNKAYDALNENYLSLINKMGYDKDFKKEYFPKSNENIIKKITDLIWERFFQLVAFPLKRLITKYQCQSK